MMNLKSLNLFRIIDKLNLKDPAIQIFVFMSMLILIGVVMQISSIEHTRLIYLHLAKILIAILLSIVMYKVRSKLFFIGAGFFYALSIFLLILLIFIGSTKMGAQRWLDLKIFSIQPSEIAKFTTILYLSKYLYIREKISAVKKYFFSFLIILLPTALIIEQPDLGTSILLLSCGLTIIFVSGISYRFIIFGVLMTLLITPIIWHSLHDYQKKRITVFLHPENDIYGMGYHIIQSKIAVGSGGFFGKGFKQGTQTQMDFLPEKNTDFIFTVINEEFGMFLSIIIIILYIGIIRQLYYISNSLKSNFSRYFILGVASLIFIQSFVNMSMVIGVLPVVGVPLPFISYGGTSLFINVLSIVIAIKMYKSQGKEKLML